MDVEMTEVVPEGSCDRGDVMREPDEVAAMVRLKALGCQSALNPAPRSAPNFDPGWARSGTRPGAALRVAETGRVPVR